VSEPELPSVTICAPEPLNSRFLADIGCGSGEVMSATLVPDGMERTEAQFRTILGTAGCSLEGITPTASPVSVVEARRSEPVVGGSL
jgi:hypothetical protein